MMVIFIPAPPWKCINYILCSIVAHSIKIRKHLNVRKTNAKMQTYRVIFIEFVTTHSVVKVLLRQHASLLGAHKQTASITSMTQPWSIQLEIYDI